MIAVNIPRSTEFDEFHSTDVPERTSTISNVNELQSGGRQSGIPLL